MTELSRKVCVISGSRAEYGLLYWLMKEIEQEDEMELQLVVTGMHLSPEFGLTFQQIENDGFSINEKVEMVVSSDSAVGVAKSIGLGTLGFSDAFNRLKPDIILILGDRFEMLAAAQTALVMQIPIAHIHGGELTLGAYDDSIRHAITKMATWHFVSSESHRKRVIQLGENPNRIWNVGALGIENILKISLLSKAELYAKLNLNANKPLFIITYHSETNGDAFGIHPLLEALTEYSHVNLVFTKANADNGGRYINKVIEQFVVENENASLFDSLGQLNYLSAVKHSQIVIGNSSSGLIEVPYLHTPTINCGGRQEKRERPTSVIDSALDLPSIQEAIIEALQYKGPYDQLFGSGNVSIKIVKELQKISSYSIQKEFYDL